MGFEPMTSTLPETRTKVYWILCGVIWCYAGYTEHDDLVKLYQNLRSEERYKEFKERQKVNSPLGRLGARVKKFLNPNEQKDSPKNTTNDSNVGEER